MATVIPDKWNVELIVSASTPFHNAIAPLCIRVLASHHVLRQFGTSITSDASLPSARCSKGGYVAYSFTPKGASVTWVGGAVKHLNVFRFGSLNRGRYSAILVTIYSPVL
jgi:hypothetical protein